MTKNAPMNYEMMIEKMNLQLNEELARTTSALPPGTTHETTAFEKFIHQNMQKLGVEGLGILDSNHFSAEHEVLNELENLIDAYHPRGLEILQLAHNEYKGEAKMLWNDLRDWDKSIPCTHENCEHVVLSSRASNTQDLWAMTHEKLEHLFVESGIDIEIIHSIINWDSREIDWNLLRGCIHGIILKMDTCEKLSQNGDITVGHHTININDMGSENYKFGSLELKAIEEIDREIAAICHFMNLCGEEPLSCPDGHDLWQTSIVSNENSIYDFNYLSRAAIESCIRTVIGNAVASTPKTLIGRIEGKKVDVFRGKIGSISSDRVRQAIAESVLLCNSIIGKFEVAIGDSGEKIEFCPKDNLIDKKTYCAVNSKVVEDLTWKIKQLKPYAFFLNEGKSKKEWEHWAGNAACDILHAFNIEQFLIRNDKSSQFLFNDGSVPKHETNLLRLNNKIQEEIAKKFSAIDKDGREFNALELLLNKETTPPMLCFPLERPSDNSLLFNIERGDPRQGGFLSNGMQTRFPVISNNTTENEFDIIRFEPSELAVKALNNLQMTEWAVNEKVRPIVEEMLVHYVKENVRNLFELRKEKKTKDLQEEIYCIDMSTFPKLTLGQITHWNASFKFMDMLEEKLAPEHRSFFHSWNLDWRGRMYTCSTILDPQNDDFSRGLIQFANSKPLTENGWIWLKRYTASLMRDRELDPVIFTPAEIEQWGIIQQSLSDKSFTGQDNVVDKPEFMNILGKISQNPMSTKKVWADGDIFEAKSEGFQRIAAILACYEAYENGGVGALVCLPINQDASSSVYQHASMLVRDKEMAKLVNIIQDGDIPADVYTEVIEDLRSRWSQSSPFIELELEEKVIEEVMASVLKRSIAKKPVMTISYGATKRNMIKSLLTHNGQNSGLLGGWVPLRENSEKFKTEVTRDDIQASKLDERDWKWRMIAHPSSILNQALNQLESKFHERVAEIVIDDLLISVNNKLPGFKKLMNALEQVIDDSSEDCVKWELSDGSIIRNIKLKRADTKPKSAPITLDSSAVVLRRNISDIINNKDSKPAENMLIPINWKKLSGMDEETLRTLKLSETKRFETLIEDFNSINLTERTLFNFENRKMLKREKSDITNREISELNNDAWNNLDLDSKNNYSERIGTFNQIVIGSSIDNWEIDWNQFRLCSGLKPGGELINTDEKNSLHPKIKSVINMFVGKAPCTFSRKILSGERNTRGEKTGITPNFVHSHDAFHMRLVVSELWDNGVNDIWSVHDSFGCHPNQIGMLRDIVVEKMKLTQSNESGNFSTLDDLIKRHLKDAALESHKIEPGFELDDVNGIYLIS
ncbi:hypothetical protein OAU99_01560 [Candidatus Poseidoniaceae archaeon]|nr:hypothetical protein [Candidatus Poseidoniaceae archaeon]